MELLEGGTVAALDWRSFGKCHVSIHFMLSQHGGIVPAARRRSLLILTLAEREDTPPTNAPEREPYSSFA